MVEKSITVFQRAFPKFTNGLLLGLTLIALFYSLTLSWRVFGQVPLREAASRSVMAANSKLFYDSGVCEPLPVFLLKAALAAGANPEVAVRAEGLAVFAAVAIVTIVILRRRCGAVAGMLAAFFLAATPYMGYYAMLGDSHLYAIFFLLLFWHYYDPSRVTLRRAAWAGLYGALACLSRLDSFWIIILVVTLFAALDFRNFNYKAAGVSFFLAAVLVCPYLVYQRVQYKNALYAQELGLRRWANLSKDGSGYAGPAETGPLSVPGFIFRDGAAGALRGVVAGLGRSLFYELPKVVYYKSLMVLVFLGFYAAFALKKYALPVFFLAAFLPVLALAPIPEIPSTGGIALRYYLCAFWALCALAGMGLQEVLIWANRRMSDWVNEKSALLANKSIKE
ncbi:MAG: hypothetical protein A2234_07155 [Elusimicrobia bacterium RIFOXYA2_FULL_58_8]|nr:MAG: hypothetical protein A2234_07155 [Elusimicrobia bacterium RIFOXYA2_FULL_58_8]OGS13904.1 MAG: hypothetical protein A2285_09575 [Elusimicrobia bacterium RIFOXYA12_FULL_57_11]